MFGDLSSNMTCQWTAYGCLAWCMGDAHRFICWRQACAALRERACQLVKACTCTRVRSPIERGGGWHIAVNNDGNDDAPNTTTQQQQQQQRQESNHAQQ